MMRTHKERTALVQSFVSQNKLFVILAIAAAVWLIGSYIFSRANPQTEIPEEQAAQSETADAPEIPAWEFYPIDAGILLAGGGFCVIMIVRERRKAKEELQ